MCKAVCPQNGAWMVLGALCIPVVSVCFVSSTFSKAASAPDWTGNVFTVTERSLSVFVLPFMRLRLVSIIAKARNPLEIKQSILISKLPLSGTHVLAVPLPFCCDSAPHGKSLWHEFCFPNLSTQVTSYLGGARMHLLSDFSLVPTIPVHLLRSLSQYMYSEIQASSILVLGFIAPRNGIVHVEAAECIS